MLLDYVEKRLNPRFMVPRGEGKFKRSELHVTINGFSERYPVLNISERGAAFESEEKFKLNEELMFQLLVHEDPLLDLFSQVRRQNRPADNTFKTIGIEFMPFGNGNSFNSLEKLEKLKKLESQYGNLLQPNIAFKSEWGIVNCIAKGNLNNTYLLEVVKRALKIAEKNECRKIMFDFSEMNIVEPIVNIYDYPALAKSENIPTYLKIAILYSNDYDNFRFLETVSRNSGYNIRVFMDNDLATKWLLDS